MGVITWVANMVVVADLQRTCSTLCDPALLPVSPTLSRPCWAAPSAEVLKHSKSVLSTWKGWSRWVEGCVFIFSLQGTQNCNLWLEQSWTMLDYPKDALVRVKGRTPNIMVGRARNAFRIKPIHIRSTPHEIKRILSTRIPEYRDCLWVFALKLMAILILSITLAEMCL